MISQTRQNILYSMLGVILNTIVPIIVFPYVSRVLGVDALGKYNFNSSVITYLQLFISFGVSLYGVREVAKIKDDIKLLSNLYSELISINIIIYLSLLLIVLFVGHTGFNKDCNIFFALYLPLIFSYIGPDWLYIGLEKQRWLLVRNLVIKGTTVLFTFLFVRNNEDLLVYVLIVSLGMALPGLINIFLIRKHVNYLLPSISCIKKHILILFQIFVIEILLRYLGIADVVLLGIFKSDYEVGLYSMALKVVLLSNSVMNITATTLLPKATKYISCHDMLGFIYLSQKTISLLLVIGSIISALIYINAKLIVMLLGGLQYVESIMILKMLTPVCTISPIINMLIFQVLYPQGKTKLLISIYSISIFFNLVISILLVPIYSYLGTIIAYISTLLFILILLCIFYKKTSIGLYFNKDHAKIIFSLILIFLIMLGVESIGLNSIVETMIFLFLFSTLLVIFKEDYIVTLLNYFKKYR